MNQASFLHWLDSKQNRCPLVMGILNVTPDSFSDGGRFSDTHAALAHAIQMTAAGADLIDIGGESTRPGAAAVRADEQLHRVLPVITAIQEQLPDIALSIDTTSAQVAEAAVLAGASLINDVSAGQDDPAMLGVASKHGCPIVLMHRPGPSRTMQNNPTYGDVLDEVSQFLLARRAAAETAGISREKIILDPGIGFGKTLEHDLRLLKQIRSLASIGQPLLIGVSRKKFIGRLTGVASPADRIFGTAAAVALSVANGADIVRVHDVAAMKQVVSVAAEFR